MMSLSLLSPDVIAYPRHIFVYNLVIISETDIKLSKKCRIVI